MYKFMNNPWLFHTFFAPDGAGEGGNAENPESGETEEADDGDQGEEEQPEEKRYTKKELSDAIEKRLARERRKWQKEKLNSGSTGSGEKAEDTNAADSEKKVSALEMKVACYEQDVAKDSVEDVAALAAAYMERDHELDLEEAIEKVVSKYPQFKKTRAEENTSRKQIGAWGERQGKGQGKEKTLSDEITEQLYGKKG